MQLQGLYYNGHPVYARNKHETTFNVKLKHSMLITTCKSTTTIEIIFFLFQAVISVRHLLWRLGDLQDFPVICFHIPLPHCQVMGTQTTHSMVTELLYTGVPMVSLERHWIGLIRRLTPGLIVHNIEPLTIHLWVLLVRIHYLVATHCPPFRQPLVLMMATQMMLNTLDIWQL